MVEINIYKKRRAWRRKNVLKIDYAVGNSTWLKIKYVFITLHVLEK